MVRKTSVNWKLSTTDAGIVGERAGLDDVHAPGGERAGHVGEEPGAVARDDGEIEELAVGSKIELDRIFIEVERRAESDCGSVRAGGSADSVAADLREIV